MLKNHELLKKLTQEDLNENLEDRDNVFLGNLYFLDLDETEESL